MTRRGTSASNYPNTPNWWKSTMGGREVTSLMAYGPTDHSASIKIMRNINAPTMLFNSSRTLKATRCLPTTNQKRTKPSRGERKLAQIWAMASRPPARCSCHLLTRPCLISRTCSKECLSRVLFISNHPQSNLRLRDATRSPLLDEKDEHCLAGGGGKPPLHAGNNFNSECRDMA